MRPSVHSLSDVMASGDPSLFVPVQVSPEEYRRMKWGGRQPSEAQEMADAVEQLAMQLLPPDKALDFFRRTEPRRYYAPGGYYSHKHLTHAVRGGVLTGTLELIAKEGISAGPDLWNYWTSTALVLNGMPAYWLSAELLRALVKTAPPDNMLLEDLKFPFPSCAFLLPENFLFAPDGQAVTFIAYSRGQKDETIKPAPYLPSLSLDFDASAKSSDAFIHVAGLQRGGCYSGWLPVDAKMQLGEIMGSIGEFSLGAGAVAHPDDPTFSARCTALCLSLIMVMSARPHLVTHGVMKTRAKMQAGEYRPDIHTPNWIGEKYRIAGRAHQGGTHAGPDLHMVPGHWRNVVSGARVVAGAVIPAEQRAHTLKWIEPYWRGGADA